jgi:DNA primase
LGPRTDDDFREKLRALADIREIIGGYLPLKKAGNRFRGLCPFHSEKTPSFHVDPGKQLFYCFGCGTGGDVFRFLMLYEKVDFPEALRMLARRYGVPLPEYSRPVASEKQALLKVHRAAVDFFRGILKDSPEGKAGREYVSRRRSCSPRGCSFAARRAAGPTIDSAAG